MTDHLVLPLLPSDLDAGTHRLHIEVDVDTRDLWDDRYLARVADQVRDLAAMRLHDERLSAARLPVGPLVDALREHGRRVGTGTGHDGGLSTVLGDSDRRQVLRAVDRGWISGPMADRLAVEVLGVPLESVYRAPVTRMLKEAA